MYELFDGEYGTVKFVKVDGEYRFAHNMGNHKHLVLEGEKAESAGFVYFDTYGDSERKYIQLSKESSMSLNHLGPDENDSQNIAQLLGFDYKG